MKKLLTALLLTNCLLAKADQIEDGFTRKINWFFGKQDILSTSFDAQSRTGFVLVEVDQSSAEYRFILN